MADLDTQAASEAETAGVSSTNRLSEAFWLAIREHWEFDPDEPSTPEAVRRAAEEHGFYPPSRVAANKRARKEGWTRRGAMQGVLRAAQQRADAMVQSDGNFEPITKQQAAKQAWFERSIDLREESEIKRAEVLARHRSDWKDVIVLREEGMKCAHLATPEHPDTNIDQEQEQMIRASAWMKLAKLTAETIAAQQAGERKAWGMDEIPQLPDVTKMTDAALQALVSGKTMH